MYPNHGFAVLFKGDIICKNDILKYKLSGTLNYRDLSPGNMQAYLYQDFTEKFTMAKRKKPHKMFIDY